LILQHKKHLIFIGLSAEQSGTHVALTVDSSFELQSTEERSKKANHLKGWDANPLT